MSENTETTGGTRFSSGKPNAVGTPIMGLMEVFRVVERGAEKYALLDWEVGQSFKTLLNSGFRHYAACLNDPLARDEESGLLHAAHAAWNLLCLLHFVEVGRADEMDDITEWQGVTAAMKREMEENARAMMDQNDERIRRMMEPMPELNPGMDGDRPHDYGWDER